MDVVDKSHLKTLISEFPRRYCSSRYLKKRHPDIYAEIIKQDAETFREQLYIYVFGGPGICKACGMRTKYIGLQAGYHEYCSYACSAGSDSTKRNRQKTCKKRYGCNNVSTITRQKAHETMLRRYGVKHAIQSPEIRAKVEQTTLQRYGVKNASQSPEIRAKVEQTTLQRYGVKTTLILPENRELIKKATLEKYGVTSLFQLPEYREKITQKRLYNLIGKNPYHIGYEEGAWKCSCPHQECEQCSEKYFVIPQNTYHDRLRHGAELCTRLFPIGSTNQKTSIEIFVHQVLDSVGVEYITNTKSVIPPLELDIYIPSLRIAIECNGVYWHSKRSSNYHINKFERCKAVGVHMITLWEDQIFNKPQVVESMLLSKLGIYKRRLYARKCDVVELDSKTANDFLESNHIQGRTSSSIKLGLVHQNELVSVMTFSNGRGCQGSGKSECELNRFCSALNTQVIGAAGKLLKYYIRHHHPKSIISFAHRDISDGGLYETLGFTSTNKPTTSYYYIQHNTMKRYHRSTFTKSRIVALGWKPNKTGWTESQVMSEHNYLRIYDTGVIKWTLRI